MGCRAQHYDQYRIDRLYDADTFMSASMHTRTRAGYSRKHAREIGRKSHDTATVSGLGRPLRGVVRSARPRPGRLGKG